MSRLKIPDATAFTAKAAPQLRNWQELQHQRQQQGTKKEGYQEFFDKWHSLAKDGGGRIISPPGSNPITIEAVKDSLLDRTMRTAGYNVMGMGSRMVAGAIKENVEQNRYAPERVIGHAGEAQTVLFSISLPKG
jgi:hypothetical protein